MDSTDSAMKPNPNPNKGCRVALFQFLEAHTHAGLLYEYFTIFLILLSCATFVLARNPLAHKCVGWCDAIWYGNYADNALAFLGLGATSLVEMFVVAVFSVDYVLRFATADLLEPRFAGPGGRLRYVVSFFALVDLASTLPFYVDAFLLPNSNLPVSTSLRALRLIRMMKVEGSCVFCPKWREGRPNAHHVGAGDSP